MIGLQIKPGKLSRLDQSTPHHTMNTAKGDNSSKKAQLTYFCLSALYDDVSSSKSFEFISMKVFKTLYTSATMVLQNNQKRVKIRS